MRQIHGDIRHDAGGSGAEDDDAVGDASRLGDRMRDEHGRGPALPP
jgi:hypothetical protein